jgi:hypothetical protein
MRKRMWEEDGHENQRMNRSKDLNQKKKKGTSNKPKRIKNIKR